MYSVWECRRVRVMWGWYNTDFMHFVVLVVCCFVFGVAIELPVW